MTIFQAQPYDERKARRRRWMVAGAVVVALIAGVLLFWFLNYPEERIVDRFLTAIEHKDYNTAYGIWRGDPDWQKHLDQHKDYLYGQFELDWGPSGEWGTITSHHIDGSLAPPAKGERAVVSGIVVKATINDRAIPACLWVEKKAKTINYSPYNCK